MSFFGADPETPQGIASGFVGGIQGIGDVGALVKNAARYLGFSDAEPNHVEVLFAGLGLGTEAAVGYGEIPDIPISSVRSLLAALGNAQAGKILAVVLKRALANGNQLVELGHFLRHILDDSTGYAFQVLKNVFTSTDVLDAAVRVSDDLADGFFTGIKEVSEMGQAVVGTALAQQVVKTLDALKLNGNVWDYVKGLSAADLERFTEHLGVIYKAGKLDPAFVERILSFDSLFSASYTRLRFLEDLRLVSHAPNVQQFAVRLLNPVPNFHLGPLYELQSAAEILRGLPNAAFEWINRVSRKVNGQIVTDFDFIIDGVYYQAKRGWSGETALKAKIWIEKARRDGAVVIKYVTPGGRDAIPTSIQNALRAMGIPDSDILNIPIP